MKYKTEQEKLERKVKLFFYIRDKPFRDFNIAAIKCSKAIANILKNLKH